MRKTFSPMNQTFIPFIIRRFHFLLEAKQELREV
jgi:hypothetical protein